MKIQSRGKLTDSLDGDLAWRKVEIATMKKTVDGALPQRQPALLRGSVTMLYAHWEGFVKNAATAYLSYVANRGLMYGELAPNFLGLAIKRQLDESAETRKAAIYTNIAHAFGGNLQRRAKLPYDVINTESNLSIAVFQNILALLAFSEGPYSASYKPVIERLVFLRNNIAHGREMRVVYSEYVQLHDGIIGLMDQFKNDIEDAAANDICKRSPAGVAAVPTGV